MINEEIPWLASPIPSSITRVAQESSLVALSRFSALTEVRNAPSLEYPERCIYWPRAPLGAVVLPGGILALEEDELDPTLALGTVFAEPNPGKVLFWGIGAERYGVYSSAEFNREMLLWIRSELILSPVVILKEDSDLLLICDEQLHFLTFGATHQTIASFESKFGSHPSLRGRFVDWVSHDGIGFGANDRVWASETLVAWSNWPARNGS